jgi:stage II sporulation protein R
MCSVTQKGCEINMKRKIFLRCIIGVFLAVVLIAGVCEQVMGDISGGVVRLHIIANSDTEYDQNVKLAVRDSIIVAQKRIFPDGVPKNLTYEQRELLTQAAEGVLRNKDVGYGAKVETGKFYFPTKKYENITFPAGRYDAVRVVLGEGTGQNWWCVMYPPLCFTDCAVGSMGEKSKDILKEEMGETAYEIVSEESFRAVPALKILELWGKVKK